MQGGWGRFSGRRLPDAEIFPSLEAEVGPWRKYLHGRVLNAGAGSRSLRPLVDGEVVNLDIPGGLHNRDIDVYAPLDDIPFPDGYFDVCFCNAVLEHVEGPGAVVGELSRVLKPGGLLYLTAAFMQPEHLDPGDYCRFSRDGLRRLASESGCQPLVAEGLHSIYHTLAWIADEWLGPRRDFRAALAKAVVFPYLRRRCRTSRERIETVASAHRLIAVRLPAGA